MHRSVELQGKNSRDHADPTWWWVITNVVSDLILPVGCLQKAASNWLLMARG
jgi:hypothetical protein